MTETEWLAATELEPMLGFLREKTSERRVRLFAVACCRRIWNLFTEERSRKAVEMAECFADGLVSNEELLIAGSEASESHTECADTAYMITLRPNVRAYGNFDAFGFGVAHEATLAACGPWLDDRREIWSVSFRDERIVQCGFLRDIFGNPFRPVAIDPSWLTATVVALTESIYQEKAFDRMPILADALEEAGCDNAEILNHCRQPGEHVRGCWVVDLLLGKD